MGTSPRTIASPIVEAGMRTVIGIADAVGSGFGSCFGRVPWGVSGVVLVGIWVERVFPCLWGSFSFIMVTAGASSLVRGLFRDFCEIG